MVTTRDRIDLAVALVIAAALVALACAFVYDARSRLVGAAVSKAWLDEVKFRDVLREGGLTDGG